MLNLNPILSHQHEHLGTATVDVLRHMATSQDESLSQLTFDTLRISRQ